MKKDNVSPVRIYRNELNETAVKRDLQSAQTALNSVLRVWNELELTPCNDIVKLITNPEKCYSESIDLSVSVPIQPGAKYQISKDIYIKSLQIPIPDSLYRACREARKVSYTNMPELWSIENDNTIVLNETEAETLIDSQSIYASGEKIQLAKDLQKFVELFNSIDSRLQGELLYPSVHATNYFLQKFSFSQKRTDLPFTLGLLPEVLKRWLSL